ncbi:hypothetical protein [Actinomadura sp. NPDC000929]|uniref:hypothetical protein n=1 Tax=Actinomadura sp. NPDC000929 TaxID=3154517 RepID=UPI00339A3C56
MAVRLQVPPEHLAEVAPHQATLADLRHWAGLTAQDAAAHFWFSRWSLLRIEKTGQIPALGQPNDPRQVFIATAADLYARPCAAILAALARTEQRAPTLPVTDWTHF